MKIYKREWKNATSLCVVFHLFLIRLLFSLSRCIYTCMYTGAILYLKNMKTELFCDY